MLPITRWQQRCTGWMEPSKQALKSGILACTLLTSPAFALSVDDAKHLALRTSFAANPSLMNALLPLTREEAVDYVLNQVEPHPVEPPEFVLDPNPKIDTKELSAAERKEYNQVRKRRADLLKQWLVDRLITTDAPFNEFMTLFWMNHFTSSIYKPFDSVVAYNKHELEMNQSLGRFDLMLKNIMQDPAVIIYLDNQQNRKSKPNENLARELLELYTLGEGNYKEEDIKEVARALTGWSVVWADRKFTIKDSQHDGGVKRFLGEEGNYTMNEVLNVLLDNDNTSKNIVSKLWMALVSPNIKEEKVNELASSFKKNNYKIKPMLRDLLLSEEFWDRENRSVLVKSPVELLIGMYRQLEVSEAPSHLVARLSAEMGQNLFAPPNVKGWPIASSDWINSDSILKRQNAINRLMRAKESNPHIKDQEATLNEAMQKWVSDEAFNYQKDWLLAAPPVGDVSSEDPMLTLKNLLTDPVYQLK